MDVREKAVSYLNSRPRTRQELMAFRKAEAGCGSGGSWQKKAWLQM